MEQLHINSALLFARLNVLTHLTLSVFDELLSKEDGITLRTNYLLRLAEHEKAALSGLNDLLENQGMLVKAQADSFFSLRHTATLWGIELPDNG